jgi:hypothetical protein
VASNKSYSSSTNEKAPQIPQFNILGRRSQQRSIQPLKSAAIISIPLESVQIQRIGRPHQLLPINHTIIEIPLLKRGIATTTTSRKPSGVIHATSCTRSSRFAVAVTARPSAGVVASSRARSSRGCQFAQVVFEELEFFFVEACDAVAAGDHFREDGVGDVAQFVDVAEEGRVDGVRY